MDDDDGGGGGGAKRNQHMLLTHTYMIAQCSTTVPCAVGVEAGALGGLAVRLAQAALCPPVGAPSEGMQWMMMVMRDDGSGAAMHNEHLHQTHMCHKAPQTHRRPLSSTKVQAASGSRTAVPTSAPLDGLRVVAGGAALPRRPVVAVTAGRRVV